jgi:hypothetical protein
VQDTGGWIVLTNAMRNFNADSCVGFAAKDYLGTDRSATGGKSVGRDS